MLPLNTSVSTAYSYNRGFGYYIRRFCQVSQMDYDYAFSQMIKLCYEPSTVYICICFIFYSFKMTSYRKQTKDQWARDDPAFVVIQLFLLIIASLAYGVAFRNRIMYILLLSSSSYTNSYTILFSIGHYLLVGIVICTICWLIANSYLRVHHSHSIEQRVEWLYAFDVHCNSFFPYFLIIYVLQYFLLPILLTSKSVSTFLSVLLYATAIVVYCAITTLGYSYIPFIERSEVFFTPVLIVLILGILCLIVGINPTNYIISLYH